MIKEYNLENGKNVDIKKLISDKIPLNQFIKAHKGIIVLCHDVFILYKGGILLVTRDNLPAKDITWPIGGRIQRGMSIEDSLKKKVMEESSLKLKNI